MVVVTDLMEISRTGFGFDFSEEEAQTLHTSYSYCWEEMDKSIKGSPIIPGMT